jgi:hypothetical protein
MTKTSHYNAAAAATVRHLRNAATWEPQVAADGFSRTKMNQVVTGDSLERYLKANRISGDERDAVKQAFVTLAGRQSQGETTTAVNVNRLRTLSTTLKGFAATHNKTPKAELSAVESRKMGSTAKAIIAGTEELRARSFTGLKTEKAFSKKVDTLLEHLLVKANVGNPYLQFHELVNFTRDNGVAPEMRDALWKSFRYIGRTMTHGETNSTQICIDQRQEAHRILMKLFTGTSATRNAIEKLD